MGWSWLLVSWPLGCPHSRLQRLATEQMALDDAFSGLRCSTQSTKQARALGWGINVCSHVGAWWCGCVCTLAGQGLLQEVQS